MDPSQIFIRSCYQSPISPSPFFIFFSKFSIFFFFLRFLLFFVNMGPYQSKIFKALLIPQFQFDFNKYGNLGRIQVIPFLVMCQTLYNFYSTSNFFLTQEHKGLKFSKGTPTVFIRSQPNVMSTLPNKGEYLFVCFFLFFFSFRGNRPVKKNWTRGSSCVKYFSNFFRVLSVIGHSVHFAKLPIGEYTLLR